MSTRARPRAVRVIIFIGTKYTRAVRAGVLVEGDNSNNGSRGLVVVVVFWRSCALRFFVC